MSKLVDETLAKIAAQDEKLEAQEEQMINRFRPPQGTSQLLGAREKILDADMAVESEKMARLNLLQQSTIGMQAQTNQMPGAAL